MTRNILIPIDGSENSERAFHFYLENLHNKDDVVLILHIQTTPHLHALSFEHPLQMPTEEWNKKLTEEVQKAKKLIEHYEILCEEKKIHKQTLLGSGKPGEVIVEKAKEKNANMIVMGSRGMSTLRRTFVGSTSDYVLHHTHIPITIVPPKN